MLLNVNTICLKIGVSFNDNVSYAMIENEITG